jgi:hypothetical protein
MLAGFVFRVVLNNKRKFLDCHFLSAGDSASVSPWY